MALAILHDCSCGRGCKLRDSFYCTACSSIVCRHPQCAVRDIDTYYCTQCLKNYTPTEAMSARNRCSECSSCPTCAGPVKVAHSTTPGSSSPKKRHYYSCGYCRWESQTSTTLVADSTRALQGTQVHTTLSSPWY